MDGRRTASNRAADAPVFAAISEAVLAVASERSLRSTLERLVHAARRLAGARYAALGVPDDEGGFERFIVSGISAKTWDAIGELPRQHGLLGAMLEEPAPYRTNDIRKDPRFEGYPAGHPGMRSFLGVPAVARDGRIVGAFYLTSKRGAPAFTENDQAVIEMLAAHAASAIENAQLSERSRELTVMEERNRLARELHDSVTQTLFSAVLTAEAVAELVDTDPGQARERARELQDLARDAVREMRSLIFELRPADLDADGLVPTLRKHVEILRRVAEPELRFTVSGERRLDGRVERELFRVAQEALNNALRHGRASSVEVELAVRNGLVRLSVHDDGVGFDADDPRLRTRHLGLTSMRERADTVGGRLAITSAPGRGTVVVMEVPV